MWLARSGGYSGDDARDTWGLDHPDATATVSSLPSADVLLTRGSMAIHVAPSGGKWAVRRTGAGRASRRFIDQAEAITWAQARSTVVYVHDAGGRIVERWSAAAEIAARRTDAMARLAER